MDSRIERVFDAWNDQDADRAVEQFADDGRFYEVPRGEDFSRAEFRAYLAEMVFEVFPDYTVERTEVLVSHDWATVVDWTFSGTHKREVAGIQPTGNSVTLHLVSIITISDEGITSWRDFYDSDTLDEQLGGR